MDAGNTCVHSLTHVLSSCPFMYFMVSGITPRLCAFALNISGFHSSPVFTFNLAPCLAFNSRKAGFLLLVILSIEMVKSCSSRAIK